MMKTFETPSIDIYTFGSDSTLSASSPYNPGEGGTPIMPL